MSGPAKIHRVRASLGFSTLKIAALIAGARNIYTKMSANLQLFPSPIPALAIFLGLITSIEACQPAVKSKTPGARTTRDNAAHALITGLQQLLAFVQGIADATPENAAAIIASAGMLVHSIPNPQKAPVTLTHGQPSGTVLLRANVALLTGITSKAVFYSWSYSVDGEKTWLSLPGTPIGRTTITGLTPLTTVAVRVAVTVGKQPMGAWSPVSTLVVL